MNLVNLQQKMCLNKMKSDEKKHSGKIKEQQEELNQILYGLKELLEE